MELSGLVAILNSDYTEVVEVRDLGPNPVPVRPVLVRPLIVVETPLGENQQYEGHTDLITEEQVTRTMLVADIPVEVPEAISDRQYFQYLAMQGLITEEEALAAVSTGTIPSSMMSLIYMLPEEQHFPAKMLVAGATIFNRSHPLAEMIRQLYQWTPEQLDNCWIEASKL